MLQKCSNKKLTDLGQAKSISHGHAVTVTRRQLGHHPQPKEVMEYNGFGPAQRYGRPMARSKPAGRYGRRNIRTEQSARTINCVSEYAQCCVVQTANYSLYLANTTNSRVINQSDRVMRHWLSLSISSERCLRAHTFMSYDTSTLDTKRTICGFKYVTIICTFHQYEINILLVHRRLYIVSHSQMFSVTTFS